MLMQNSKNKFLHSKIKNEGQNRVLWFPHFREKYYKKFGVVEIQKTFYQPPQQKTALKWRDEAPPDFEFCLKAWQLITHSPKSPTYRRLKFEIPENKKKNYGFFKPTSEVFSAWEKTEKIASILKAKIIVFQCPSSFAETEENKGNLEKFFKKIKRENYLFAWEPRGYWKEKEIERLCKDLDLIHCVDPFKNKTTTKKLAYFRLHGKKRYRYNYTDYDLVLIQQNKPIYVGETLVVSRWSWEGTPINRDFARLNKPLPYRKILLI